MRSRLGSIAYVTGWLTFAAGFAAVFWFGRPDVVRAVTASLTVVTPAAILGLGVVELTHRLPLEGRRAQLLLLLHLPSAVVYSLCWIASIWAWRAAIAIANGTPMTGLAPAHIVHWHLFAGTLLYSMLALVTIASRYVSMAESRRRLAELRALGGALSPHFMLNALHSIYHLAREDPECGERMVSQFAQVLTYIQEVQRDARLLVRFEREWTFTRQYLEIERVRLGDRLEVQQWADPATFQCLVPPMALQPLVENAIKHGVARRVGGGWMRITATLDSECLWLSVVNAVPQGHSMPAHARGSGLDTLRERLRTLYADRAGCIVDQRIDCFEVRVHLPISRRDHRGNPV